MKKLFVRAAFAAALALMGTGQAFAAGKIKVALTYDDLPVNGGLPPGVKQSDIARDTLAVFKKHGIPKVYGFINAQKLERNPDGALALKLWIESGNPLANHTYSHIDLTRNSVEDFNREVLRNEPALELLTPVGVGEEVWRWFRYPYLHEGDTLEKRRAVRGFLARNHYRIAQTTIDWEDYLWNSAHARCAKSGDAKAIEWLRESYLAAAKEYIAVQRDLARKVFGRDINHVMLLHLGSFSSLIMPDLFALLDKEGYEIVTLEEAQSDPIYETDPDIASGGGTLTELMIEAKPIPYPEITPKPRERLTTMCQ